MMKVKAELVYSAGNTLGEGPFAVSGTKIHWFDIFESSVFRFDTSGGGIEKIDLDHFLCCAGETVDHTVIAAGEKGVMLLDDKFEIIRIISPPPFDTEVQRFNDGKAGPDGAFWAGSMSYDGDKPIGGLYRFGNGVSRVIDGMLIPNGLGWSPDGTTMYITDSGKGQITQWDFDAGSGVISNERPFISAAADEGVPDGLAVDEQGNIWSACWGGRRIKGFDPDGSLFAEITVEAVNPTSCCFGGPDHRSLFITSARHGLEKPGPSDGALFKADTGTRGPAPCLFSFI